MDQKILVWAALGLAIGSIVICFVDRFGNVDEGNVVERRFDSVAIDRRLDEIDRRIEEIEKSARAHSKLRALPSRPSPPVEVVDAPPFVESKSALTTDPLAERFLTAMARFARYESSRDANKNRLTLLALDKSRSVRDRRESIENLREQTLVPNDLDDQTIASLFESLTDIEKGRDREQIVAALIGVTNPAMIDPLIKVALYDSEDDAREAAIDALAHFGSLGRVQTALEQAARQDKSPKVRRIARRHINQR